MPFVNLVENHQSHTWERGVALQTPCQDSFGYNFDSRVLADHPFVTGLAANEVTGILIERMSQTSGSGSRRQTTGFEHDDALSVHPRFGNEPQGDERCLTRPGWSNKNRALRRRQSATQVVDNVFDGEISQWYQIAIIQPRAGVPAKAAGSPVRGIAGAVQAVVVAMSLATDRQA